MAEGDASLVEKSLKGDQQAYGQLYDRYAALVRSVCYNSIRDDAAAADLTQDVFLRAHGKLGDLKEQDRFGPWLIGIAKNVAREHRRKLARDRHRFVGLETPEPVKADKEKPADRDELLEWALSQLQEKERLAIQVHYLQDDDAAAGARLLGVSRASYYRMVDHARKKLARIIDRAEHL